MHSKARMLTGRVLARKGQKLNKRRLNPVLFKLATPTPVKAARSVNSSLAYDTSTLRRAWLVLGWVTDCGWVNHLGM